MRSIEFCVDCPDPELEGTMLLGLGAVHGPGSYSVSAEMVLAVPNHLGGGKVLMVAEYISVQLLVTLKWGTAAMLASLMLFGVLGLLFLMSKFMKLSAVFGGSTR